VPIVPDQFANFTLTTVAGGAGGVGTALNAGDGTMLLPVGVGNAYYPSVFPFMVLLGSAASPTSGELVQCTGRTGDQLTIVRSAEGTSAQTWPIGTAVQQVETAGNLKNLWTALPQVFNVMGYGAVGNGTTDDTTAIQAAINACGTAGGGVVFLPNLHAISVPLNLAVQGVILQGAGPSTGLKALVSFSGAEMIYVTAQYCGIRDMAIYGGPNTSSATNPAVTAGIECAGVRYNSFRALQMYYINGWAIETASSATIPCVGTIIESIHVEHCAKGLHILGNSATNFVGQQFIVNFHPEVIDNGDGLLLEDVNDVEVVNMNGAVAGGAVTGSMIRLHGQNASHFFSNIDLGSIVTTTVSPIIMSETGVNGNPTNITMVGGVAQGGLTNVVVNAGTDIFFSNMKFKQAGTDGVQVPGTGATVTFDRCSFAANNQSNAGTAYDINIGQSSGAVYVTNCSVETGIGSGVGLVTHCVNDTSHTGYFFNTVFTGSGVSPSTVFAGSPQLIRSCPGYNPRGSITPPTITASPYTVSTSQNDVNICFTAINGMTAFKINTVSIGLPALGMVYHVTARVTVEIDWATTAPTWVWIAD
jgi:hypothetical protein